MSEARRRKPPNKKGCKPVEDVCVEHDRPLICRHGCESALPHKCKDILDSICRSMTPTTVNGGTVK